MRGLLILLASFSLAACKPDITSPFEIELGPAPVMTVVFGAGQEVALGAEAIVRVRLTRADGSPMAGSAVSFHYLETIPNQIGGGTITFRDTNSDGVAELRFVTTRTGPFTVTAEFYECTIIMIKGDCSAVVRASAIVTGTTTAG